MSQQNRSHRPYPGDDDSRGQLYTANDHPSQRPYSNAPYPSYPSYHGAESYHPQHYPDQHWQGGVQLNEFTNSEAGPSRTSLPPLSRDLYANYPPTQYGARSMASGQSPPTPGPWSANSMATTGRSEEGGGGGFNASRSVKLDDLVSHDPNVGGRGGSGQGPGGFTTTPLPAVPQTAVTAAKPAGEIQSSAGPSEFVKKLFKMLEEEDETYGQGFEPGKSRGPGGQRGSVAWARGGSSFVVWDMNEFSTKVLPQTFRHSNFSSFVRQLNKYGFSKIKHIDEETGVLRENVSHTMFRADSGMGIPTPQLSGRWRVGPRVDKGKSFILDHADMQRKITVPKKTEPEAETSPAAVLPPAPQYIPPPQTAAPPPQMEFNRFAEMEARVRGLEEKLLSAVEDVQKAKMREQATSGLLREILNHMTATERASSSPVETPGSGGPSPRIRYMWQMFEQLTSDHPRPQHPYGFMQPPRQPTSADQPGATSGTTASPQTDGSRNSFDGAPGSTGSGSYWYAQAPRDEGDIMPSIPEQSTYRMENGAPVYNEPPAWLTKGVTVPMPMYHRKNSDGVAYRLMMEALGASAAGYNATEDPSEPVMPARARPLPQQTPLRQTSIVQTSPFGTVLIPPESSVHPAARVKSKGKKKDSTKSNGDSPNSKAARRGSVDQPHWNKTPLILVVEDDMVYRQLSSKFLEKFGCVVETVENAHEAIAKMNSTKYDLVLMDIFFGPSMDGRKATSLIRQFDSYTPIISMTSNNQPQDVVSYYQSGMNDVLAKPFTKHGLFCILDKHLLHMKALQLSAEVPRSVGVPPLSDQRLQEAVAQGAAEASGLLGRGPEMRNPLAGMGWSDDTYQIVLAQFLQTGMMPDVSTFNFITGQPIPLAIGQPESSASSTIQPSGSSTDISGSSATGGATIRPNMVFGDYNNRKRSLEVGDEAWRTMSGVSSTDLVTPDEMPGDEGGDAGQRGPAGQQTGKRTKRV